DIGRGTAAGVGFIQGINAKFGDELAGLQAAGGGPTAVLRAPVQAGPAAALYPYLVGLARLGYEKLTGQNDPTMGGVITGEQSATSAYEQGRDQFRDLAKTAEEQYPGTTLTGEVGGAIFSPLGKVKAAGQGATWLQRAYEVAKGGARYGGAA